MIQSMSRETLHRNVYLFALAMLVCCLPLSKYMMSISQFLLAINWMAEGRFRQKTVLIRNNPSIAFFASVFLIYAMGMLYTGNMAAGLTKIKNVLPLLLLPVVLGTSYPLSGKELKGMLLLFAASVVIAALVCVVNYLLHPETIAGDFRSVSVFMPHHRFSLLILMAAFILLYMVFYPRFSATGYEKSAYLSLSLMLISFLFFLRSFTGIILLIILGAGFMLRTAYTGKRSFVKPAAGWTVIVLFTMPALFIVIPVLKYFQPVPYEISSLEKTTAGGNHYTHNPETGILENGNYVDLYVCEPELKKEWDRISRIPYDGTDKKGQLIRYTLIRYLTSKNLRKDSAGLSHLEEPDVTAIEHGLANFRFKEKPGISQRLYEIIWEIHVFDKTGFVRNHSVGQRIIFFKTAVQVVLKNLPWGTGTGDVYDVMLREADDKLLSLSTNWEGKPHNQYLFFLIAFGLPGFLWIMFSWIYPAIVRTCYTNMLFNIFAAIILISMFANDTLESYVGIVFFSFFYSLFGFASPGDKQAASS
ncbi:MAG TPA: O-antigen ligase family protein [Bacteroidales bacterium]|nr:O-antigen ligase family protein [Bacteroidales bacterium]